MSTQTWKSSDHPRNTTGGLPGNRGAFAAKQQSADASVALGYQDLWQNHSEAVNDAAGAAGIYSGHAFEYRSTALLVNPAGNPEASINLTDDLGNNTQLSHDYTTGVTTFRAYDLGVKSTDPETVRVVVDDICSEHEGDPAGMFNALRAQVITQENLHPSLRAALTGNR